MWHRIAQHQSEDRRARYRKIPIHMANYRFAENPDIFGQVSSIKTKKREINSLRTSVDEYGRVSSLTINRRQSSTYTLNTDPYGLGSSLTIRKRKRSSETVNEREYGREPTFKIRKQSSSLTETRTKLSEYRASQIEDDRAAHILLMRSYMEEYSSSRSEIHRAADIKQSRMYMAEYPARQSEGDEAQITQSRKARALQLEEDKAAFLKEARILVPEFRAIESPRHTTPRKPPPNTATKVKSAPLSPTPRSNAESIRLCKVAVRSFIRQIESFKSNKCEVCNRLCPSYEIYDGEVKTPATVYSVVCHHCKPHIIE